MRIDLGEYQIDDLERNSMLDYIKQHHYYLMLQSKKELLNRITLTKWDGELEAYKSFFDLGKLSKIRTVLFRHYQARRQRTFKLKAV